MLKNLFKIKTLFFLLIALSLAGCDDVFLGFDTDQLVGSQWYREYYWQDEDGSWERGQCRLTFYGSIAQEDVVYQGKGWTWSPEYGDEFKAYSGKETYSYNYYLNGNDEITFYDRDGNYWNRVYFYGYEMISADDASLRWQLIDEY